MKARQALVSAAQLWGRWPLAPSAVGLPSGLLPAWRRVKKKNCLHASTMFSASCAARARLHGGRAGRSHQGGRLLFSSRSETCNNRCPRVTKRGEGGTVRE